MVKVALLGCGTMGRVHTNGYKNITNAQLTAVCDINEEKAIALAEINGSKVYTDFDEMLQKETFDVLDVCLPTYMHKEYAIRAMSAGKHVLCEKPIALTVSDAREMIHTAEKMNVKFSVGHVVRFFPAYKKAVETVASGKIGVPKLIRTTRNQAFPRWSWENWYHDYQKSGGPIMDLVIHDFDWIAHYFGDIERVYAKSFNGNVPEQEHCMVTLRMKNGAIAHVEGSWAYPAGSVFRTTFEIVGTQGQIEYDSMENCGLKKQVSEEYHITSYPSPIPQTMNPYTAELREFVNCVENEIPLSVTGEQALKALIIALAAMESSKEGKPVSLGNEGDLQ